ncbi:Protocatechuate 3,4-dioxygenase beta subunit OS=Sphingobium scionense OX=1404341 GN=GGQ90_000362 PE=4 SV=1 [Sphingobium scionense]
MMQDGAHDDHGHGHGLADDLAQMRKLAGEAMGRRRTLRLLFRPAAPR